MTEFEQKLIDARWKAAKGGANFGDRLNHMIRTRIPEDEQVAVMDRVLAVRYVNKEMEPLILELEAKYPVKPWVGKKQ